MMEMRIGATYVSDPKIHAMVCEVPQRLIDLERAGFKKRGKPYSLVSGHVVSCWANEKTGECAFFTENAESIPVHILRTSENANKYFNAHLKAMLR